LNVADAASAWQIGCCQRLANWMLPAPGKLNAGSILHGNYYSRVPWESKVNASNPDIEKRIYELLADRPDKVTKLAIATRAAVHRAAPKCSELLYVTYCLSDAFTFSGKLGQAFIHIATYANHVNLGFNFGAKLDDPDSILEGSGKLIRHTQIDSLKKLKSKPVTALISQAAAKGRAMADEKGAICEPIFVLNQDGKKTSI